MGLQVSCALTRRNALSFYCLLFLIYVTGSLPDGIVVQPDEMAEDNVSFTVTLKRSHVDGKQHGLVRGMDFIFTHPFYQF